MQQKNEENKRKRSAVVTVFLLILCASLIIFISIPLTKNLSRKRQIDAEIKNLEKEIADLEGKRIKLSEMINFLQSDQYIEDQARANLNYKKEGEEVIIIKKNEAPLPVDPEEQNESVYGLNINNETKSAKFANPKKWWNYFIH